MTSIDLVLSQPFINEPPTADAGGPYLVDEGTPFLLDASGSSDIPIRLQLLDSNGISATTDGILWLR